ncbi:MAG: uracil-xanthine permease family protein, partial [Bacillota bacterium]
MDEQRVDVVGYLPDDTPPIGKLIVFALQHVIVMFPATVLVAILTGFDVGVTIVASGVATLGFILVTRRRIPLYYGSSFSYIAAVSGVARVAGVQAAQCGIVGSGLVSILAGWLVKTFGQKVIKRILPPVVTGSVAIVIGIALAFTAMNMASLNWTAALITLMSTILFSAFLKGTLGQLPVLFGVVVGYVASLAMGIVDFKPIQEAAFFAVPKFTLPVWSPSALLAIMPVAIATIPESTAHLYQIDLYVNDVAGKLGRAKK